jgi:hypothetical protein
MDLCRSNPDGVEIFTEAAELLQKLEASAERDIALGHIMARQAWFLNGVGQMEKGQKIATEALELLRNHDCLEETIMPY